MSSVGARPSASEGIDEVPHFVIEIAGVMQRLPDFSAGDVAEAAAQSMNCHFERAFAEIELRSRVGLRGA